MSRHARRSSSLPQVLLAVATAAVLGLGAWAGAALRAPDTELTTGLPSLAAPDATGSASPGPVTSESAPSPPADLTPSPSATPTITEPAATQPPPTTAPPAPPAPPPVESGSVAYEEEVVALVNAERAAAGCPAVTVDGRLTAAARAHSADMAARGYFAHTTPDGVTFDRRIEEAGYAWSYAAENIARGQPDPEAVMRAWMNSDGHRRNILNCRLVHIGVGLVYDANDRPHWTQDFATPR